MEVTVLDCSKKKDTKQIAEFSKLVEAQYAAEKNYVNVFPWIKGCKSPFIHFIAHTKRKDGRPLIGGWLTLLIMEHEGKDHGYLSEISTRRTKDEHYGGVGQLLHSAMLQWAAKHKLEFVYLWPLNEGVRAIYMKPDWGYVPKRNDVHQLFRVLRSEPPNDFLDTLVRPDETEERAETLDEYIEMIEEIVETLGDEEFQELLEKARPFLVSDNPHIADFLQNAQILETLEEGDRITEV